MYTHPNSLHETAGPARLYYCALCDTDVDAFCWNVGTCEHKYKVLQQPIADPDQNAVGWLYLLLSICLGLGVLGLLTLIWR